MTHSPVQERLVDTAARLLHDEGAAAISVDRILDEAGVARQTLYKHFFSKDDLVLAARRRCCSEFRVWFRQIVGARERRPRDRLVAIFDILDDWFQGKAEGGNGFARCTFVTGCVKLSDLPLEGREIVLEHKRLLFEFVLGIAKQAVARDPEKLTRTLVLLMNGAIATAHGCGDRNAALRAKPVAADMVAASCPEPGSRIRFSTNEVEA